MDVSGRLDTLRLVLILLDWFTAKLVPRSDHTVCLTGGAMSMMLIELPVLLISSRVCVSSWSEEGLLASVFLAEKNQINEENDLNLSKCVNPININTL